MRKRLLLAGALLIGIAVPLLTDASAAPVIPPPHAVVSGQVQNVYWVCRWGRCWWVRPHRRWRRCWRPYPRGPLYCRWYYS